MTAPYVRTIPERRPEGHVPKAPRWSLAFEAPVSLVTADYVAIQLPADGTDEAELFLELARQSSDGPDAWELLTCTDEAGAVNLIQVSYWLDPSAHARWLRSSKLGRWYAGLNPAAITFGAWHETVQVPPDRLETIASKPGHVFGLGRAPGTLMRHTTTNGYYGAARDRFPVSAVDPLEPAEPHVRRTRPVHSAKRRLRAECGHNTVVIRSGQLWESATGDQLDDYVNELQPKLLAGMRHLVDHADSEGTLSLRITTNLDKETLQPRRETSVYAHFASLEHLERWAKTHQTHARIYAHAIRKQQEYGDKRSVVTWHEVFVLPRTAAFEYVNCHPGTGILPFAPTVMGVE
ncbi:phenylacetaldoxime dehydratase family protein [Kribbella solani]|uniref:phenylacetaldoxime dehydratase family protein n=1 Tax=Kribbella solani TaxID=236067 RepID=UPI0029B38380|nr:phenylacetaldoxime dehydratase family protein [Kribbella solani]MDX3001722.1 phenylacetaldoxime dehydratase family protein [Kribbella solani]